MVSFRYLTFFIFISFISKVQLFEKHSHFSYPFIFPLRFLYHSHPRRRRGDGLFEHFFTFFTFSYQSHPRRRQGDGDFKFLPFLHFHIILIQGSTLWKAFSFLISFHFPLTFLYLSHPRRRRGDGLFQLSEEHSHAKHYFCPLSHSRIILIQDEDGEMVSFYILKIILISPIPYFLLSHSGIILIQGEDKEMVSFRYLPFLHSHIILIQGKDGEILSFIHLIFFYVLISFSSKATGRW